MSDESHRLPDMTHAVDAPSQRLALVGDLDLARVGDLRADIDRALATGPATIGLDLSGTTFLDCAGLQALIWAVLRAQAAGVTVRLISSSAAVDRTLDMTGSRGWFTPGDTGRLDAA